MKNEVIKLSNGNISYNNRILREHNSNIYLATINGNKYILDVYSRKIYIKI